MDTEITNVGTESVETPEVAEPETANESAETQEVAEPEREEQSEFVEDDVDDDLNDDDEGSQNPSDAAFASMRRELQEARRQNEQMQNALKIYFNGDDADSLAIQARAYAEDRSEDEVRADIERETRLRQLEERNQELEEQIKDAEVHQMINDSVATLSKIDPTIKGEGDLEKLGDVFLKLIANGVDTETAYWASKAEQYHNQVNAPNDIGKASPTTNERDYYTSEEIDALSEEEIRKNWDKVQRSMSRL